MRTLWMASSPSDRGQDLLVDDVRLSPQPDGTWVASQHGGCMSRDVSFAALLEGEVV